jgi:hypothetical protein
VVVHKKGAQARGETYAEAFSTHNLGAAKGRIIAWLLVLQGKCIAFRA